jgi:hypothetical protein
MTSEETAIMIEFIRARCRRDSIAFTEFVITDEHNKTLNLAPLHKELHKFVLGNKTGIVEFHRESGKTTNMIALAAWLIQDNQDVRIKIVSSSDKIAVSRGKAIRQIIESPRYQLLFPHVKPGREWSDSKFSVRRAIIAPASTVECFGLHSKATGERCDWIFLDDPDDAEVVTSKIKRESNKNRVLDVWINLLGPEGRAFLFCTPWHNQDVSGCLKAKGWDVLRKPVINMHSPWAERWTPKALQTRLEEIGSISFARGFHLEAVSEKDKIFKEAWFQYWDKLPKLDCFVVPVDVAISEKEAADFTAIGLLGGSRGIRKAYLVDTKHGHFNFAEQIKHIIEMAVLCENRFKHAPTIGIEVVGYQEAAYEAVYDKIQELFDEDKIKTRYRVERIKVSDAKYTRAVKLSARIENGGLFLHSSQKDVKDELLEFPVGGRDDYVDMLGSGVEMLFDEITRGEAVAA